MRKTGIKYLLGIVAGAFALLCGSTSFAGNTILPYPNQVEWKEGTCRIEKRLSVYCDEVFKYETKKEMDALKKEAGVAYRFSNREQADFRVLFSKDIAKEGYTLDITGSGISIQASAPAGVFYAVQTLKQLLQKEQVAYRFPCVEIADSPAFPWRGFLLDEARNFQGKKEVKKLLDEMAMLKMNVFHWHLTDDQGWRIEIKKYPRLTEVGGRRDSTQLNWYESTVYDKKPVSGYYTQKDIREIVAYAAERHITIVPEIEFPGHASAAIAAYPWLGCSKKEIPVSCAYGVFSSVFDIADSRTQQFVRDVLDEVAALFPSDIIHIGGDEVKYDEWQNSENIKRLMEKEKVDSPAGLQIWFANRLSSYLKKKGKKMMGWNDITGDKLHAYHPENATQSRLDADNTIVQFWLGTPEILEKALRRNLKIVNSYCDYTYLNYNYDKIVPGLEYAHKPIPMEKAYNFYPVPEGWEDRRDLILGVTCAMWGEWINRPDIMYKMVYPQVAAYAEVGWTERRNKEFGRFTDALEFFKRRWTSAGYIR